MNTNGLNSNMNTKVSFSVKSKPNQKAKPSNDDNEDKEDQPKKEFVTEFDPNKTLTDSKKPKRVIVPPPKVNEWRQHKKMKNLELSMSESNNDDDQLQWELEKKADADADGGKISFGLNLRNNSNFTSGNKDKDASRSTVEAVASKDFKHELERLPEDEGFQQFEDMPVEEFGAALLGGLGWYEGRGIGKNSKGNVKIKEFGKKTFVSDDVIINKEKDKQRDGLKKSKESRTSQEADREKQQVKVNVKHQESKKLPSRESETREENKDKGRSFSWLRSHIRVRIISKEFKKGRLYLKKGEVVDVVGPTTCDVSMDESGELIQGVDQDILETALPRRGGPVLVLYGRHKGVYGNLIERDFDRESGVVRDADTHDLLNVKLEQIAEYIGDPSYIGY